MKNIKKNKIGFFTIVVIITVVFTSCEYQEFADTDYPDQLIYMPAAFYNNYMIDAIPGEVGDNPTPGYPERFKVDATNNSFNILLAVYRAGINANGSFDVNIAVNTDTIQSLLATADALPEGTVLLEPENYSIVNSVQMNDGERLAKFDLEVDLDHLVNSAPGGVYALGVEISSEEREVNPDLAITVIVIDTKIMLPTADFLIMVDGKTILTRNESKNAVSYLWDFGDGNTSTEKDVEHTYDQAGAYTITLTAVGVSGEQYQSVLSKNVNIN